MMWPKQSECITFYGDPKDPNFEDNLVLVPIPWMCVNSWDGKTCKSIKVHRRCAQSLIRILAKIWEVSGKSQDKINQWGMNKCGGGYAYRVMRGGTSLSMHAYGCAVDFDPARNELGDVNPNLAHCIDVIRAFKNEGWTWGGGWKKPDGMHFQAAC
jgi:hypothetical protein